MLTYSRGPMTSLTWGPVGHCTSGRPLNPPLVPGCLVTTLSGETKWRSCISEALVLTLIWAIFRCMVLLKQANSAVIVGSSSRVCRLQIKSRWFSLQFSKDEFGHGQCDWHHETCWLRCAALQWSANFLCCAMTILKWDWQFYRCLMSNFPQVSKKSIATMGWEDASVP